MSDISGIARSHPCTKPRRHVAFAIDWQGDDDELMTLVFAGAEMEWLVRIFESLCGSASGLAEGFTIKWQTPPYFRNGYVNERLAVVLKGRRPDILTEESLMLIIRGRLERYVYGGHVDCYRLDDFLNLSRRAPDKAVIPQPMASAVIPYKKKKKRKPKAEAPMGQEEEKSESIEPEVKEEEEDMANIYLRVPWYVAAYFRGRDSENPLTEWQPLEFSEYSEEYMLLENNLRYFPEQVQSHVCYSQTAWNNILRGRRPDGGEVIIKRDPKEWPDIKEICTLIGMANHGRQSSSEYLAVKMPREVYFAKKVHRTNQCYCLSYDVAIKLASKLTTTFIREYLAWTEYRREYFYRQLGRYPKTIDVVEMFFTQFNFPPAIRQTDRESLRRMHTRWLTNAKKRPDYHFQFDDTTFLEHISDDDRHRVEQWEKRNNPK